MTTKTFRDVNNGKAGDSNNWTPSGTPMPGDTLFMQSGSTMFLGSEGGGLAGNTLTLGIAQTSSNYYFDLAPGAVLATTTAASSTINATVNVEYQATATLGQSYPSTANYTVNLASGAMLKGGYNMALDGSMTMNAAAGSVFENDGNSINDGTTAIINVDVVGGGSFTDGVAQSHLGALEFGKSVAATETVNLMGDQVRGNVTLTVDNPKDFHAAVTLFDGTITLKGLTADSYNFSNNTLTLYDAGAAIDTLRLQCIIPNGLQLAPVSPLSVSQSGSDITIFSGTGATPSNPLPLFQQHVAAAAIFDTTTNSAVPDTLSQPYTGPVAGLQTELIDITPDNLNIMAMADNLFIKTGAGNDAVSLHGGTNVVDAGSGSNFLTSGGGFDTFFLDARNIPAAASAAGPVPGAIWDTIQNFGHGDAVTLWGIGPGTALVWQKNEGAVGHTGLTLHANLLNGSEASLTLAGIDNRSNLSLSYGSSGSASYLYVKAA